ncbi:hypothetical protein [Dyella jiangningensis]|nr:hypothetical protein [Dyella jiangningensis]
MTAKLIRHVIQPYRVALASLVLVTAAAVPSGAMAITVFDPTNFVQNLRQAIESAKSNLTLASQLSQLMTTVETLQKTYSTIESTIGSMGLNLLQIDNQLKKISTADMQAQIQQECGGLDPVGAVMSFAGFDMNTDVRTQQRKVCQQIIEAQTHKYNTAVDMLTHMNGYSSTLGKISDSFAKITNFASGDRQALTYHTNETLSAMTMDMNNAEQMMKADDATIAALQTRQSQLAKVALRGSSSMIGNAMQGVIFASAFSAN